MGILLTAVAVCLVAAGYRIWASHRAGERTLIYDQLRRDQHFRTSGKGTVSVPEMAGATDHIWGQFGEFEVHVFENSSDFVEPGQEIDTRTIMLVSSPRCQLPHFHVEPRGFATSLKERVGGKRPVPFPQDETFEASQVVTGPDHDAIRHVLTPSVLELLGRNRDLFVESCGDALLFYEPEALLSSRQMERVLEFALQIAGKLTTAQSGKPTPPGDR